MFNNPDLSFFNINQSNVQIVTVTVTYILLCMVKYQIIRFAIRQVRSNSIIHDYVCLFSEISENRHVHIIFSVLVRMNAVCDCTCTLIFISSYNKNMCLIWHPIGSAQCSLSRIDVLSKYPVWHANVTWPDRIIIHRRGVVYCGYTAMDPRPGHTGKLHACLFSRIGF